MSKYSPPPISARFPKGERRAVVAFVAQRGLTVSAYIKALVRADMAMQNGVNTGVDTVPVLSPRAASNTLAEMARGSTSVRVLLPTRASTRLPVQRRFTDCKPAGKTWRD